MIDLKANYTPGQIAREGLIPGEYGNSKSKSIFTIDRYIRQGLLKAEAISIGKNKQYIVKGSDLVKLIKYLDRFDKFHTKKSAAPQL